MDPGNWATSLAGGSKYGYGLLTVALLSNIIAILLQALSSRHREASGPDVVLHLGGHRIRRARVHPDRAECQAFVPERRVEHGREVQRRLPEAPAGERVGGSARKPVDDRLVVYRSLGVDVRNQVGGAPESSGRRASAREVGARRDPAPNEDLDLVAVRLVGDLHVARATAWDLRRAVVPQPRVVVELEGQERRTSRVGTTETEVQERVTPRLIDSRPDVQDVALGRLQPVRLRGQISALGFVLLASPGEGRVIVVGVRAVHDRSPGTHALPVDQARPSSWSPSAPWNELPGSAADDGRSGVPAADEAAVPAIASTLARAIAARPARTE